MNVLQASNSNQATVTYGDRTRGELRLNLEGE